MPDVVSRQNFDTDNIYPVYIPLFPMFILLHARFTYAPVLNLPLTVTKQAQEASSTSHKTYAKIMQNVIITSWEVI